MIILETVNKSLELLLGGAVTLNQLPIVVSYVDVTYNTYTPLANDTISNNVTPVTIAAAPAALTQRQIKLITVYNADSLNASVTIQLNNTGTKRILVCFVLLPGSTLVYTDGEGFRVLNSSGQILEAGNQGPAGLQGIPGYFGLDGQDGLDCFPSNQGPQGIQGAAGTPGASGVGSGNNIPFFTDILEQIDDIASYLSPTAGDIQSLISTGVWTPADGSGAGLVFSVGSGTWIKIGPIVIAPFQTTYPSTADASNSRITGLPFTTNNRSNCGAVIVGLSTVNLTGMLNANAIVIDYYSTAGVRLANSALSLKSVQGTVVYVAAIGL